MSAIDLFAREKILIRQVTYGDLPALEWDGEYTHYRRLYQEIYRTAQRGEAVLWVLEHNSSGIVGQLFVQLKSVRPELADGRSRAYFYAFRIKSHYREHGFGTYLLRYSEADLIERNFNQVVLNVRQDDFRARGLYERNGYRIIAAEPGKWSYIDDKGKHRFVHEPSWRMMKCLRQHDNYVED